MHAQAEDLRYLRREGNRRVRAQRRRRTALRMTVMAVIWIAAAAVATGAAGGAARWALGPGRFQLQEVEVRGTREAQESEIKDLVGEWMGRNVFSIALSEVERKVREHPWIGAAGAPGSGAVRIQRRFPGGLLITVRERVASGLALVGGTVFLLDEGGLPIDRYGPRYARYDFPIIKGLEALMPGSPGVKDETRLREALATGVRVTRLLAEREPAFYQQVSEIDVSDRDMVTLRLDEEDYDLRLSREDPLMNLQGYFALRDQIVDDERHDIEYVDLRWRDRVTVMPAAGAAATAHVNGGR